MEIYDIGYGLHVIRMCPLLVKFYPEDAQILKGLLERTIMSYALENDILVNSGNDNTEVTIVFNIENIAILLKTFKTIYDNIISDYLNRSGEIEGGYNIINHSFDILLYKYKRNDGIFIKSAHYLRFAMSNSIICNYNVGLNKKLNTSKYSATFNAVVYAGKEVNKLAECMHISPYLYRDKINSVLGLYKE